MELGIKCKVHVRKGSKFGFPDFGIVSFGLFLTELSSKSGFFWGVQVGLKFKFFGRKGKIRNGSKFAFPSMASSKSEIFEFDPSLLHSSTIEGKMYQT